MTRANDRPVLRVDWVDSCSENTGWSKYRDIPEGHRFGPSRATTVGFLVMETDEAISLSPNAVVHDYDDAGDDDAFDFVMTIPKVCITKQKRLTR